MTPGTLALPRHVQAGPVIVFARILSMRRHKRPARAPTSDCDQINALVRLGLSTTRQASIK